MPIEKIQNANLQETLEFFRSQLQQAQTANIRLPVRISGTQSDNIKLCHQLAGDFNQDEIAWIVNKTATNNLLGKKPNFVIGKEFTAAFCQFNADTDVNLVAALAGTIRGGGIFVFLVNETEAIELFEQRVIRLLQSPYVISVSISNGQYQIKAEALPQKTKAIIPDLNQQIAAIQQILHTASGRARRPLLITAPRGRGKSAALGMATTRLVAEEKKHIILTAPSRASATVVFKHFEQTSKPGSLEFIAPDELINSSPEADLLIIDEAASLPTPMLKTLINKYSRVVLATTTEGYEGSGQGFNLRFKPYLIQHFPQWHYLELTTPVRWSPQDLLEPVINKLFLLNAKSKNIQEDIQAEQCEFIQLSQKALIDNEALLEEITGLLQLAHYKTRPSDLKQLFNNDKQKLFLAKHKQDIVAVAIGIEEGPLDQQLAPAIYQGRRRPQGNILPQTLLFHLELTSAPDMRLLRIMRIAVHPDLQSRGIGSELLQYIERFTEKNGFDAIGSSFGANAQLLHFWLEKNYKLLRIGLSEKASSGMHSALIFKTINPQLETDVNDIHYRFMDKFKLQLLNILDTLDEEIIKTVFRYTSQRKDYPEPRHWQSIYSYAFFNRPYEDCIDSLQYCLLYALQYQKSEINLLDFNLLTRRILQNQSPQNICEEFGFSGKKQVSREVKAQVAKLIFAFSNAETKKALLGNPLNKF